jgi:hypothetical protein
MEFRHLTALPALCPRPEANSKRRDFNFKYYFRRRFSWLEGC